MTFTFKGVADLPPAWRAQLLETTLRNKGAEPAPQAVNQWERDYAKVLDAREAAGEILLWRFGEIKLRIGGQVGRQKARWYKPDFVVWAPDGIECHEVKGYFRDDAKDRIAAAADRYPFRFVLVRKVKGGLFQRSEVIGAAYQRLRH